MRGGLTLLRSLDPLVFTNGADVRAPVLEGTEPALRRLSCASGHFALASSPRPGHYLLARDPLGVHKLFFALAEDGLEASTFWIDLVRRGHDGDRIWSVPAGHLMSIDTERRTLELRRFSTLPYGEGPFDAHALRYHATAIRTRLTEVFRRLKTVVKDRPVYVALSGGLDSTGIAALAREHLRDVTAITFAVADEPESEDMAYARHVAQDLGIPLVTVRTSKRAILETLDDVLLYGQDWRDFNVHCALVNAALGKHLEERHPEGQGPRPILLTGDTMNELMADYSPVAYGDEVYYRLPRLEKGRLRRVLVAGLDAGDREVGVLARYGVSVIQPYALAADAYTALPDGAVQGEEAKQNLVRAVLGDRVPAYVYDRPKVRAQCGSEGVSGTLAVLADAGIGARELMARFADLFRLDAEQLPKLMSAGRYRFPTRYPAQEEPVSRIA